MSEEEATALESAETEEVREGIMRSIRARHAAARLEAAVTAGDISAGEAERLVDEVRRGDHSSALRRRINDVARRDNSDNDNDSGAA